MSPRYDVIILGSGPAGLTAGIYTGRARLGTLILGDTPGGSPILYDQIGNFPGFPGGVPGAQLMMNMVRQVDDLGATRMVENVTEVSEQAGQFRVQAAGEDFLGRALIVATGSHPIRLNVPGEGEFFGQGVFHCAHCDAPVFQAQARSKACVVGGGDSALQTALYVSRYAEDVTIIHRRSEFRANRAMQEAVASHPKISVRFNQEVAAVLGEKGRVTALRLRDRETGAHTDFPTEGVFVGIGQKPNSQLVKDLIERDENGFILVNSSMETSRRGVFAAGDVIQKPLRQIVTAVGDGAVAADSATKFLAGDAR